MIDMTLKDSRRLTGPNLISPGPGAVVDVELPDAIATEVVRTWRRHAERILEAVDWQDERCYSRTFPGGASMVISAPVDALYAATEINEWAWEAANAELTGASEPDLDEAADRLRKTIETERNPSLMAMRAEAATRGVAFLSDDELVSVGLGKGSITWKTDEIPSPDAVDWEKVYDIPVALITGTNGKTTTVRLLASMAWEAGFVQGACSTDWIRVGNSVVERGDYSGPGGARKILRHQDVSIAFLETARGGILRRGLAVNRAEAALVTNVAEDHLGEYGITDLKALVETKLVVSRIIDASGRLVVNADDPELRARAQSLSCPILWFSLHDNNPIIQAHLEKGGDACFMDDDRFVLVRDGERHDILPVGDAPVTLNGAARHNIANALAAIGVASGLGLTPEAMAAGLAAFHSTPQTNPGRCNMFEFGGVKMLVDFAHNPHGMGALVGMASVIPASRRLIILGQAGDRDDASIRGLARNAWRARPDLVILKEMEKYLRGRQPGEIPAMMEEELVRAGAPRERLIRASSEMDSVEKAIRWARKGDLLLLLMHGERDAVFAYLEKLKDSGWEARPPIEDES